VRALSALTHALRAAAVNAGLVREVRVVDNYGGQASHPTVALIGGWNLGTGLA
jgi:hypothetical protein